MIKIKIVDFQSSVKGYQHRQKTSIRIGIGIDLNFGIGTSLVMACFYVPRPFVMGCVRIYLWLVVTTQFSVGHASPWLSFRQYWDLLHLLPVTIGSSCFCFVLLPAATTSSRSPLGGALPTSLTVRQCCGIAMFTSLPCSSVTVATCVALIFITLLSCDDGQDGDVGRQHAPTRRVTCIAPFLFLVTLVLPNGS